MSRVPLYPFFLLILLCSCAITHESEPQSQEQELVEGSYDMDSLSIGHDYVDLGICNHLCWATMNLGATAPSDPGELFSWGDTASIGNISNCYWHNYRFFISDGQHRNEQLRLSKYNTNQEQYEEQDNFITLQPIDDAAHVMWGGAWRLPDAAELDSLLRLCEWTPDTVNGKPGFRVSGKREGYRQNSIFLPHTGAVDGMSLYHPEKNGYYWSRNILTGSAFNNGIGMLTNKENLTTTYYFRYIAQAIRPVFLPGEVLVSQVKINKRIHTISLSESMVQLSAIVTPSNASNRRLFWASSDERIATVDTIGRIHPVREGVCYISATSTDGTSCSATCMITVIDPVGTEHEYVDLGICNHLWWATVNVGASVPEEVGDYFSHESARRAYWGEHWRLPTSSEIDSLLQKCRWTWTVQDSMPGYLVSGLYVDGYRTTSIFLPAGGRFESEGVSFYGQRGYYWSSSELPDVNGAAINLAFSKEGAVWNYNQKHLRHPVRMVYSRSN